MGRAIRGLGRAVVLALLAFAVTVSLAPSPALAVGGMKAVTEEGESIVRGGGAAATTSTGSGPSGSSSSGSGASFGGVGKFIVDSILQPVVDSAVDFEANLLKDSCTLVTKDLPDLAKFIPTDSEGSFVAVAGHKDVGSGIPMGGIIGFIAKCYDGIRPLGATFLAVLFGLQILRVVREGEQGPGQVPYVERFGWLFVRFALVKVFFDRSLDVTVGIFNAFASVSIALAGTDTEEDYYNLVKTAMTSSMSNESSLGTLFLLVIVIGLVMFLLSCILTVMMYVATYARWLQLFVMLPFAPLAFACLASDETRHFFWGYLRTIVGSALAFLITIIIARSFPVVLVSTLSSADLTTGPLESIGAVIGLAGVTFLYILAIAKSGSWAQAVLGS